MKTPRDIKYALPCAGGRGSSEKCVACAYRKMSDCTAAVVKDAMVYIESLEKMAQSPLALQQRTGSRRLNMYLYTITDRNGKVIVQDRPSPECAALLGYASHETIRALYARCAAGEDIGLTITRRRGIVMGETTPAQRVPLITYMVYNADGTCVAQNQTTTDLAERYGNTPKGMRSTLRYLGIDQNGYCMYKGDKIVQRVRKGKQEAN